LKGKVSKGLAAICPFDGLLWFLLSAYSSVVLYAYGGVIKPSSTLGEGTVGGCKGGVHTLGEGWSDLRCGYMPCHLVTCFSDCLEAQVVVKGCNSSIRMESVVTELKVGCHILFFGMVSAVEVWVPSASPSVRIVPSSYRPCLFL